MSESADGRLDLADVYVTTDAPTRVGFVVGDNPWAEQDEQAGGGDGSFIDVSPEQSYRRPEGLEGLQPPAPREYHAVPWTSFWSGDTVKEKAAKAWVRGSWRAGGAMHGLCWCGGWLEARLLSTESATACWAIVQACTCSSWFSLLPPTAATVPSQHCCLTRHLSCPKVWRYYLVPVASREPELHLDFDSQLFVLDARSATVRRCEVRACWRAAVQLTAAQHSALAAVQQLIAALSLVTLLGCNGVQQLATCAFCTPTPHCVPAAGAPPCAARDAAARAAPAHPVRAAACCCRAAFCRR